MTTLIRTEVIDLDGVVHTLIVEYAHRLWRLRAEDPGKLLSGHPTFVSAQRETVLLQLQNEIYARLIGQ